MPRFRYNAVSLSGERVGGEYNAPDREGVVGMLRQGGYYPLNIDQVADDADRATKKKIKVKPLAGFCSQMAAMLRAGVPIAKTLEILKAQTEDAPLRKVLDDVYTKVQRGNSLYDAFLPYSPNFPDIFLNMIEAGESSGNLDLCLDRAGATFSRNAKLSNKLRNTMIYPMILLVLMIGLVVLMLVFVIPSFVGMYESSGAELPGITRMLVNLSDFVVARWYIILLVIAAIAVAVKIWLDSDRGRTAFDRFKLRVPVVGKLLTKVYAARYSRTLSSLSAAGVPLVHSLNVTARSLTNRYMEKDMYKVVEAVNRGEELSGLLERMGSLPPMIVYMTRLGEESGTMDELLSKAADFYDEESDSALQAITALLEPLMIILMAVIILPVLLAVLLPVFNMYNTML